MTEQRELDGYRIDVEYNYDYHPELSPTLLRLLMLSQSVPFPASRPLRYLELGYGTGASFNIHAAACPGEYWGVDANAAHTASANALANASGAGPKALHLSFADLLRRTDLPSFDVIVAHGVWSWVSAANRELIVEILKRHLVDGGIFFMTSVALPAEAEIIPLQRLLRLQGHDEARAATALAVALQAAGSPYFAPGSRAGGRLAALQNAHSSYIVHEYRNEDWQPFAFADIAAMLAPAGLQFVSGAALLDRYDDFRFTPAQCALLASIEDPVLRETARDFLRVRRHRDDVFVKQGGSAQPAALPADQEFVLAFPVFAAAARTISTPVAEIKLGDPPFHKIIVCLGEDAYRPKRLDRLVGTGHDALRALLTLIDAGIVYPAQPRALADEAVAACVRLNDEILRRALAGDTIKALASPITGTGVPVSRHQRLFLLARQRGANSADEWAKFALDAYGPDARPGTAEILKEAVFFQTRLPCYRALGLIDQV